MIHEEQEKPKYDIDLYLFFDLLQVSNKIISITKNDSIYILIGDTPSYLKPYFKYKNRIVFNFSASGKPYGCTCNPANPENNDNNIEMVEKYYVPTTKQVNDYFNYLDTKTKLTRSYVKENWNKIVLIDSSSGMSICGTSILFNKYVGNIDIEKKCKDYENAKPLLFVRLGYGEYTNINPKVIKNYYDVFVINYDPKLIIILGTVDFLYREFFMINEVFHRYVPNYDKNKWNLEPDSYIDREEFDKAQRNLKKISKLLEFLDTYKTNLDHANKIFKIIKQMTFMDVHKKYLKKMNKEFTIEKLEFFLGMVNENFTVIKYSDGIFKNVLIEEFRSYILKYD